MVADSLKEQEINVGAAYKLKESRTALSQQSRERKGKFH